jgi:hypothetical protein
VCTVLKREHFGKQIPGKLQNVILEKDAEDPLDDRECQGGREDPTCNKKKEG